MSIVFLVYTLLMAISISNVWWPIQKPAGLAWLGMGLQLVCGLFALPVIGINIVIGLVFFWLGATPGVLGSLAGLIYVTSLVSLMVFHLKSYGTGKVLEQSLCRGLGEDYRLKIDADLTQAFPLGLDMKRILKPLPQDLPGVEVIKDIAYTQDNDIRSLDIYRNANPAEQPIKRPVLLQIHGGAWTEKMGSKNEQARPLMNHMALRDWICVSLGYRLSPSATMPEHIVDVKSALLWVKDNVAEYGGDPDFIIATGGSAGGHLCALVGLTANDPLFQPDASERDTSVQGCIPFYGVTDLLNDAGFHNDTVESFLATSVIKQSKQDNPQLWQALSPLRRIHANAPPFYIICGDADNLVPVETNASFAHELRQASDESVCFAQIPNAGHAFDLLRTPHSENVVHGIERWLAYHYGRYRCAAQVEKTSKQASM